MNNISKSKELEDHKSSSEPKLCVNCYEFFGDPIKDKLCSKCYKAKKLESTEEKINETKNSVVEEVKTVEIIQPIINTPEKTIVIEKEKPTNKCHSCDRKVGVLGFQCKCKGIYCKMHRLPEYHECTYDFASEGKKLLKNNNPQVKGEKITKI